MNIWVLLFLFLGGCISGLLAGLLGFGGGMLFMLIFAYYLTTYEIPNAIMPQLILANSMFAMFISGVSGSVKHYRDNNFYVKPIFIIGLTAVFCATLVTHFVIHSSWYNKEVFTIIFMLVVCYTGVRIFFISDSKNDGSLTEGSSIKIFFLVGCVGGTLSALAGVGGGIAMVPMLTYLLHIDIKKATAISLGVITLTAFATSAYSFAVMPLISIPYSYGLIVFPMVLPVAVGCLIFSPIGVALSNQVTSQTIRRLYVVFLVIAMCSMLYNMLYR